MNLLIVILLFLVVLELLFLILKNGTKTKNKLKIYETIIENLKNEAILKSKYIKTDARTHSKISFGWFRLSETLTEKGTVGDPTKATMDIGKKILQVSIDTLLNAIQEAISSEVS